MIVNYYIVGHYTFYVEAMLITALATCEYKGQSQCYGEYEMANIFDDYFRDYKMETG